MLHHGSFTVLRVKVPLLLLGNFGEASHIYGSCQSEAQSITFIRTQLQYECAAPEQLATIPILNTYDLLFP